MRPKKMQPTKMRPTTDCLYLIFDIIDKETKELLPYSIFIITKCYKKVEICIVVKELLPNKKK